MVTGSAAEGPQLLVPRGRTPREGLRSWAPWLVLGAVIGVVGMAQAGVTRLAGGGDFLLAGLLVLLSAAVVLVRHDPGAALLLTWLVAPIGLLGAPELQVLPELLSVQLAVAVVAFGTARWGSRATLWASGLSLPVVTAAAVLWLVGGTGWLSQRMAISGLSLADLAAREVVPAAVVAGPVMVILVLPWLVGVAIRSTTKARSADRSRLVAEDEAARAVQESTRATLESTQAHEIARLREEQARLARDVHDVVGHSLAVILTQAESAQFLPDADTAALKAVMTTIATSARTSLQDVREVLGATRDQPGRRGGLDELVEGIRGSGCEVTSEVFGQPVPMPPELEAVAFRVLQEMLTNAVKHGRRDTPIRVEQHWPSGTWDRDLRLEVRNVEEDSAATQVLRRGGAGGAPGGHGLEGMRRRLEAVGGRLDVRQRTEPEGRTFTGTAWVPVRAS